MGCSSTPENSESSPASSTNTKVSDPFEGFNRSMWELNYEYLDPYVVRPTSIAYMEWLPTPLTAGLSNFLDNLEEPASMVNNLFMGNGSEALDGFNRFWINSTIGLLGFLDIASEAGINPSTREFGDVLGYYGVGNGPYFMMPAYGPLTVRDLADQADSLYVPLYWLTFWQSAGKWVIQGLESRYELIPQEGTLRNSPDPYALSQSIYLQHQDFKAEIEKQPEPVVADDLLEEYLGHDY
ncbi:MlaA family lipoprotein [Vibrio algicola]|uniref:VacJ family lipoprotein n=1 Tax=Vibrio algicola TaxID=2662262 RepID=A0A5Q0TJ37_9VIBR|nr:MlaA family lipoprotein [Vibrio algicola]